LEVLKVKCIVSFIVVFYILQVLKVKFIVLEVKKVSCIALEVFQVGCSLLESRGWVRCIGNSESYEIIILEVLKVRRFQFFC
jgi:hypothetical protein